MVLESVGCKNSEMLLAAREKLGDEVDDNKTLKEDRNEETSEGTIAALYGKPVLHRGGQIEDDGLHDEDMYVDLGDDPLE